MKEGKIEKKEKRKKNSPLKCMLFFNRSVKYEILEVLYLPAPASVKDC